MESAANDATYLRRALYLIGAVLVFRLIYAAIFATNPAGDEAYYWDWGRQLDYGYYSKPPFIAWLYALVDWMGGGSLFGIRAMAAFLGTTSLLILYRLAADLFDARTGWYAVLLGLAAPANAVLSFFLTIDAPLVICWSTALWMLWRIVDGKGGLGSFLLLFCALAIGHLCKQMMMVFPLITLIFAGLSSETRPLLRRPVLWIVLLGSYLSLLPPLVWNARHDWITFQHTSHHFEVKSDGGNVIVERLGDFLSFLGTQLGVLSPGTAFVLFSLALGGLPLLRRAVLPHRFLLTFGALPLAVMLLLALRQGLQPNWAAVFYLSGIVLVAAWYRGVVSAGFPPTSWRRLFPVTLAVGFLLVGYFYAASPLFSALGMAGHTADPNRRLLGYDDLAAAFEGVRQKLPEKDAPFLLVIGHRDLTSQLAFGLPDQPRVYNFDPRPGVDSQYEMWNLSQAAGLIGRDALILFPESERLPRRYAKCFGNVEKLETITVKLQATEKTYTVFHARDLREWFADDQG
ncbi:MAG: glycosyltransferase family 39 protein [Verrucomicrobiales bacterium]|nr:glycosyltransferase family 39 protein [Verrucomicrobiales bacterium]